jgi:hypothetical protein
MRGTGVLFLTVAAVIIGGVPALAGMSLPTIDLQKRCRASQKAMVEMTGDPSKRQATFDSCIRDEEAARAAMIKASPDMPRSFKNFCILPKVYSPSYIEWITCLEMMIDVRKVRERMETQSYVSNLCPIIKYDASGSIRWIKACPL